MLTYEQLIKEEDIRNLKAEESLTLDYKRDFGSNKEFAKDISSFANSAGGVIIYGVEEAKGKPADFPGVDITEKTVIAKDQVIETCINPPLHPKSKTIPKGDNKEIGYLVYYIPYSLSGPHMVTAGKDCRYYHRHEGRSVPMNENEVARAYRERTEVSENSEEVFERTRRDLTKDVTTPCHFIISFLLPPRPGVLPVFDPDKRESSRIINMACNCLGGCDDRPRPDYYEYYNELDVMRFYDNGVIAGRFLSEVSRAEGPKVIYFEYLHRSVGDFFKGLRDIFELSGVYFPIMIYTGSKNYPGLFPQHSYPRRGSDCSQPFIEELLVKEIFAVNEIIEDFDRCRSRILAPLARGFGIRGRV